MEVHNKIRTFREIRQLSQEEMANKMNMSTSGYAKIERGDTKLHLDKLQQIAEVLGINLIALLDTNDKAIMFLMNENFEQANLNYFNYYENGDAKMASEIEKLKLTIHHKDELLQQKEQELQTMREVISLLKKD